MIDCDIWSVCMAAASWSIQCPLMQATHDVDLCCQVVFFLVADICHFQHCSDLHQPVALQVCISVEIWCYYVVLNVCYIRANVGTGYFTRMVNKQLDNVLQASRRLAKASKNISEIAKAVFYWSDVSDVQPSNVVLMAGITEISDGNCCQQLSFQSQLIKLGLH